ncbi:MAG: hypothetical protein E1N59_413 [Puniceicoccaceae bacterium 5H]|nr:MAG: hypothetical protein E1N59_413 [Puniceicoccaceae bacterium 5H]
MNNKVYEIVTDRILSLLEAGVCPWRRPWSRYPAPPQNFASGRPYQGINYLMLNAIGFELPFFLTFKQAKERGGSVIKGSKGLPIVFWSTFEKEEADEQKKAIPFLRYYTVFNACQIEGVDFPTMPNAARAFEPVEAAEMILQGWPDAPTIEHGRGRAAYRPDTDQILMPSRTSFESAADYYSTLFHEAGHATGAEKRLNRPTGKRFGDERYSKEELVAEMTSAFLCAHCGLDNDVIQNQAAYLQGWIKALHDDPRLIVNAAGQAQKAANLILGVTPEAASESAAA